MRTPASSSKRESAQGTARAMVTSGATRRPLQLRSTTSASIRPRFLFIGLGETDEYAHHNNYGKYLDALHYADQVVGQVAAELATLRREGRRATLLVTTDHERSRHFVNHGGSPRKSARNLAGGGGRGIPGGRRHGAHSRPAHRRHRGNAALARRPPSRRRENTMSTLSCQDWLPLGAQRHVRAVRRGRRVARLVVHDVNRRRIGAHRVAAQRGVGAVGRRDLVVAALGVNGRSPARAGKGTLPPCPATRPTGSATLCGAPQPKGEAARMLGMSRSTLWRKMRELRIG